MTTQVPILIGDSYGIARRLWEFQFADVNGAAYDLAACTIYTTYKTTLTDPQDDPDDDSALIRHFITFNASGVVTASEGLYLVGSASGGKIQERFTSAETIELPAGIDIQGDVRLIDANHETFTFPYLEVLVGVQSVTNRQQD
ncbi:MAG: hypothetical protein QM753_16010 [Thermomicrobiales bacterium]